MNAVTVWRKREFEEMFRSLEPGDMLAYQYSRLGEFDHPVNPSKTLDLVIAVRRRSSSPDPLDERPNAITVINVADGLIVDWYPTVFELMESCKLVKGKVGPT